MQKIFLFLTVLLYFNTFQVFTQIKLAPDIYFFEFTDKNHNRYNLSNSNEFLSSRALLRRTKQKISINETDLPVSNFYLDSITRSGFKILQTSKWLNGAIIEIKADSLIPILTNMSFIKPVLKTKNVIISNNKPAYHRKIERDIVYDSLLTQASYGISYDQIAIHNGDSLHNLNYRGDSMLIAILDGGFAGVQEFSSLQPVWNENRVVLMRDIVDKTASGFYSASHGANVFSIIGGYQKDAFIGTAPNAKFALIRTEDSHMEASGMSYEYPVEEFYWVAGAELADSIGADIINSSLGYSIFNDSSMSYSYQQMDGKTAISSRGAKIASSKGMIVVASAGNEGATLWKYITAPADADSILTVGAISDAKYLAMFSSRGPTSDHRIKPDIMAIGQVSAIQNSASGFTLGMGTSFSAPIITGLIACLWQACPQKTNFEVMEAIKKSSSKYLTPDTNMGYGIPDFYMALKTLCNKSSIVPLTSDNKKITIIPNPFKTNFTIQLNAIPDKISLMYATDNQGRVLFRKEIQTDLMAKYSMECDLLQNYADGIYFIHIISGNLHLKAKVVKQ